MTDSIHIGTYRGLGCVLMGSFYSLYGNAGIDGASALGVFRRTVLSHDLRLGYVIRQLAELLRFRS